MILWAISRPGFSYIWGYLMPACPILTTLSENRERPNRQGVQSVVISQVERDRVARISTPTHSEIRTCQSE
jgi:hypothetical protein